MAPHISLLGPQDSARRQMSLAQLCTLSDLVWLECILVAMPFVIVPFAARDGEMYSGMAG